MTDRRSVLQMMGSIPLAGLLADPVLAAVIAGGLEPVRLKTSKLGKPVSGVLAMPEKLPAPAIVLIHEWWGLNDQIKTVAAEFARLGYIALAVDLMDGQVATTADQARAQMGAVNAAEAQDTMASWIAWLRARDDGTGKIGTVGWCFGGGWSLNASLAAPVEATVIYYGRLTDDSARLKALKGPVLGHFATRDGWINPPMVDGFTGAMAMAGKQLTTHWYEADHAFANPTSARYDEADAKLAWDRTTAFFSANLTS